MGSDRRGIVHRLKPDDITHKPVIAPYAIAGTLIVPPNLYLQRPDLPAVITGAANTIPRGETGHSRRPTRDMASRQEAFSERAVARRRGSRQLGRKKPRSHRPERANKVGAPAARNPRNPNPARPPPLQGNHAFLARPIAFLLTEFRLTQIPAEERSKKRTRVWRQRTVTTGA
jgi:hypothetical protein